MKLGSNLEHQKRILFLFHKPHSPIQWDFWCIIRMLRHNHSRVTHFRNIYKIQDIIIKDDCFDALESNLLFRIRCLKGVIDWKNKCARHGPSAITLISARKESTTIHKRAIILYCLLFLLSIKLPRFIWGIVLSYKHCWQNSNERFWLLATCGRLTRPQYISKILPWSYGPIERSY